MMARTVGNHGRVESSCKKWRNKYCTNYPVMHGRSVSGSRRPQDLVKRRDCRASWGLIAENHPLALSCIETRHQWLELHVVDHGFVWRAPVCHLCPALAGHLNCMTPAINLPEGCQRPFMFSTGWSLNCNFNRPLRNSMYWPVYCNKLHQPMEMRIVWLRK